MRTRALQGEVVHGETPARPSTITVSGPVQCPECGHVLREERAAELDAYLAQAAAPEDEPRTSSRPGGGSPPE